MYKQIVKLPVNGYYVEGDLSLPVNARSVIVFVHGMGSDRFNFVNREVSGYLQQQGFGTLLFDLFDRREVANKPIDVGLFSQRLTAITLWLAGHSQYATLDLGYFATGSGAAAAVRTAVEMAPKIKAMVTCSGRTDLVTDDKLGKVVSPILLIAGELDFQTIKINRKALKRLNCAKEMVIVPGASHLFEEPAKLKQVATDAGLWFGKYLRNGSTYAEHAENASDFLEADYE